MTINDDLNTSVANLTAAVDGVKAKLEAVSAALASHAGDDPVVVAAVQKINELVSALNTLSA